MGASLIIILMLSIAILISIVHIVTSAYLASIPIAAGTVTTASAGGAIAFSALTLGIGAAVVYAAAGIGYAITAGMESYKSNKGIGEIVAARIWNKDKFTGFNLHSVWEGIKSAAAILWSPWLFAGAAAGKGVKMAVDAIRNNAVTVSNRLESAATTTTTPNRDVSDGSYKAIENGLSNTNSPGQVTTALVQQSGTLSSPLPTSNGSSSSTVNTQNSLKPSQGFFNHHHLTEDIDILHFGPSN